MLKLFKYLKPYAFQIAVVILLLFVQANADLALPDYMSRIVDTGIQREGIENALPNVLGAVTYQKLMTFLPPESRTVIEGSYEAVGASDPGRSALDATYKNAGAETLYRLRPDAKKDLPANVPLNYMLVKAEYTRLGADMRAIQSAYILKTGGSMLLLTLLSVLSTIAVGYLGAKTAAGAARAIRGDLFKKVESFSFMELDHFSTASLITRSTNDITQVQMMIMMGLRMFFYAPIIGIGGVIRATGKASSMWWIIALAVGVLFVIIATVFAVAVPRFKSIQKLIDRLNLVVRENLSGMMVIRAFSRQNSEAERFDRSNKELTGTMLFVTRVMVVLMPLMMLIMNLVTLLIVWVGANEVANSMIRVGDMMAFMQYSMQIFFAFIMMSMMFIMLPRAAVAAERISEVLKSSPGIVDPAKPIAFPKNSKGVVEFKDVSFRYPGAREDILQGISFRAEPGTTTAIIGTTGAGKTTLVSLIPRFYDVTAGSILVDGIDVRTTAQTELRDRIGFVPQKAALFSGTIGSNLLYAKKTATPAEMKESLDIGQASEFVFSNPEGLEAEISQGGINVSGGQRQRLTIARALVKQAPICIFDDSFSALDLKTDTKLRRALKDKLAGNTIILVTQRVAAIKDADQILVLDEGKLVGKGSHHELMDNCEVYRDIAMSQLKQEELA
jgi:ATP-binding cassette subfamily B protein